MNTIKLDATDSTNNFLKLLCQKQLLPNFTTVVAKEQTNGKGQMGAKWQSEKGKNLIMSILIKEVLINFDEVFYLNYAIALSVFEVLQTYNIKKLAIKWPNDIMSDKKKIAGILIENSFKPDNNIESIVGIGLNVNQKNFDNLPNASSLALQMNELYDIDAILDKIIAQIQHNCKKIKNKNVDFLSKKYHQNLFKINQPMPFEDANNNQFMGIIEQVTSSGRLQIRLDNNIIKSFGVKEITMLY